MRKYLLYLARLAVLIAAYLVAAKVGLSIATINEIAAIIWIPSGIALTAILLFGYRLWPMVAIGEFIVNWNFLSVPPDASFFMAIGNTGETLLAVYLLNRFGFRISLHHVKDIILLLLVAVSCTLISATIGVTSIYLRGVIDAAAYLETWKAWWISNTLSIIVITPFILSLNVYWIRKLRPKKCIEILAFLIVIFLVDQIVFHKLLSGYIDTTSSTYLIFPPLIWAALRFGVNGTAVVVFLVTAVSIYETAIHNGPFFGTSLALSLLSLQTYVGTIGSTMLILAAVEYERKTLEQRKDEFISIASHELRTPLTSIKAFSQLLIKMPIKNNVTQAKLYLKKMDNQINNMTQLINGLLNISRIQMGSFEMHKQIFALDTLLFEIVENMQEIHHGYKLLLKKPSKQHCNVYADKEYITQVITNLITNAIKYSPDNSKINIALRPSKKNTVEVSIQDYGIGITNEEKDKIFNKYYRVTSQNKDSISGLGIGLYISNEIIKLHDGKLSVVSKERKGSKFTFYLPTI